MSQLAVAALSSVWADPEQPSIPTPSSSTAPSDSSSESTKPTKNSKKASAKKAKVPIRNLLEESKIQSYLDHIAETSNTVTLADVARLRPSRHSDATTPEYENEYNALVDRLSSSFSKKQLKMFGEMMGVKQNLKGSTKKHYAVRIIEGAWNWPSLTEIQQKKRDWSEVNYKYGANLHALSRKYNVHVGFSTKPQLSLNAEGLLGDLKQLEEHIRLFKEDIAEDYHNLSSEKPISAALLQRISRLSGAFTEQFGKGQIRISFKKSEPRTVFIAKRLVTHILCDMETASGSILAHVPPEAPSSATPSLSLLPHNYALYPFLSSRSLPWNINASGAFRARKSLDEAEFWTWKRTLLIFDKCFFFTLPDRPESQSRIISASLGHILLTPPPSTDVSLNPPLKGPWPISRLLKWVREEHVGRLFMPL
ncbi:hypothetical protein BT96DRAFT_983660 [Gymnopus androsaceus JB14]|uniref:Uncharacterized protein n=1 Tax=Gymnopus androsaceus JB14 TaxID=1447944 RepID=A0A6A4IK49_9AGAR|nr:hypothetical protein BT96DRAFT_983660 [Gymnopus androsaceus JB14]